jgi:hypothetical protein
MCKALSKEFVRILPTVGEIEAELAVQPKVKPQPRQKSHKANDLVVNSLTPACRLTP